MIGPKKLTTIRQGLRSALSAAGGDPIRWLEERMAAAERPGAAVSGESEVLSSLRRFVEASGKGRHRKQRLGTTK
jgi:hypothetical protein